MESHAGAGISLEEGTCMLPVRWIVAVFVVAIMLAGCGGKSNYVPSALTPAQLNDLAAKASSANGVPAALILAIVQVESGGNPRAVSRTGAQGLMQLTAATAQRYGASNPFDPASNLAAGARFLHDLLGHYRQNVRLTLAAWNLGAGAVDFAHGVPPKAEPFIRKVLDAYHGKS
ncbi:MAG TPA: lytic transglycosylase domain-containing protein [Candidatus Acidoferrales bacterium]|nr:lytic transglycosylase domain-containing protein [Candidatus Acidoferrales bacterium]